MADAHGLDEASRGITQRVLGTGGIASVLLLGTATGEAAAVDVALTLALLAAFAAIAFVKAFMDAGKPVASICHGPWILIEAGVALLRASWTSCGGEFFNGAGKT